jgi:hypothetical protein
LFTTAIAREKEIGHGKGDQGENKMQMVPVKEIKDIKEN